MNTLKYLSLSLLLIVSMSSFAQLDRTKAPLSKEAPKFEMATPSKFTLKNGLKVIVVENHKVPRVSFQIYTDRGPIAEGEKAGLTGAVGTLMMAGTKSRSKDQLNEEIDFIGASVSASSTGVKGSSLTKHTEKILELMQDILMNPIFPQEELDLYKKQSLSGINAAKASAKSISSNVRSTLLYGKNHPYGELETEETIEAITVEDVKQYYTNYLRPNISYLIVVGDIKAKKVKKLANKYFGDWKKAEVKKQKFENPQPAPRNQVAIAHKTGAVQTYLTFSHTIDFKPNSPDVYAVKLLQSIMGGGSDGRLYKNIREDKGYTYGAYCRFAADLLVGDFFAFAEVRNEVSDSASVEFLHEFNRICKEKVTDEELALHKAKFIGSFARALEKPATFASYALNIERYGLPNDYYVKYLENINKVTPEDIQKAAKKYLKPENMWVVAVGDRDVLKKVMPKFSKDKLKEYDFYGKVVEHSFKPVPTGVNVESVISNYLKAINGEAWKEVKDFVAKGEMKMAGMPMSLGMNLTVKRAEKMKVSVTMAGNPMSVQILNGDKGIKQMQGQSMPMSAEEVENAKLQAALVEELEYNKLGIKPVLKGIVQDNGKEYYVVQIAKPSQKTIYYSVESGLKSKEVSNQKTPQGEIAIVNKISDYKKVGDVMFPHKMETQMGPQNITISFKEVSTDKKIEDKVFSLE